MGKKAKDNPLKLKTFEIVQEIQYLPEDIRTIDMFEERMKSIPHLKTECCILHDKDTYSKKDIVELRKAHRKHRVTRSPKINSYRTRKQKRLCKNTNTIIRLVKTHRHCDCPKFTGYHFYYTVDIGNWINVHRITAPKVGDPKPDHIHGVATMSDPVYVPTLAKLFGVPSNFIQKIKTTTKTAQLYLIHKNDLDKYQYPISEVHANFDYEKMVATVDNELSMKRLSDKIMSGEVTEYNITDYLSPMEYQKNKRRIQTFFEYREKADQLAKQSDKDGISLSLEEELLAHVRFDGWTKGQCFAYDPIGYKRLAVNKDNFEKKLQKKRNEYLRNLPQPTTRCNIFVTGRRGGIGKSTVAREIARRLGECFLDSNIPPEERGKMSFFKANAKKNILFENYNGQPVVLWHDFRGSMLKKFFSEDSASDPGAAFGFFETHPDSDEDNTQNIKYDTVNLVNYFNVIDAQESYEDFINGLCRWKSDENGIWEPREENKTQAYRRFDVVIEIDTDTYTIKHLIDEENLIFENSGPYSSPSIAEEKRDHIRPEIEKIIFDKALTPIVEMYKDVIDEMRGQRTYMSDEDALMKYALVGENLNVVSPWDSPEIEFVG